MSALNGGRISIGESFFPSFFLVEFIKVVEIGSKYQSDVRGN